MKEFPLVVGISCGLMVLALLFRPFFGDKKDFWECVCYSLKPNFLSWLDKDLQRDYGKSTKLGVFMIIGVGCGFLAYALVDNILSGN